MIKSSSPELHTAALTGLWFWFWFWIRQILSDWLHSEVLVCLQTVIWHSLCFELLPTGSRSSAVRRGCVALSSLTSVQMTKWDSRSVCWDSSSSGRPARSLRARCAAAFCLLFFFFFFVSVRGQNCSPLVWGAIRLRADKLLPGDASLSSGTLRSVKTTGRDTRFYFWRQISCRNIQPLSSHKLATSRFFVPSRWRLRPNSQPIPARPLPALRLGGFTRLRGPALPRQSEPAAEGPVAPSAHLKLYEPVLDSEPHGSEPLDTKNPQNTNIWRDTPLCQCVSSMQGRCAQEHFSRGHVGLSVALSSAQPTRRITL